MKGTVKTIAVLAIISMLTVMFLSGCGNQQDGPTAGTKTEKPTAESSKKLRIGYVASYLSNEFYQRAIEGMKVVAEKRNAELIIADSNGEVSKQVNLMDNFIAQKVDSIILFPTDPAANRGTVTKAKEAGIPTVVDGIDVEGAVSMVGADWHQLGAEMGKWTGEYLKKSNIKGNILEIDLPSLEIIVQLVNGFNEALKATGADYKVVANVDGQGLKETALVVATDALTAHPEVNVIMGINDDSTLGGIQAYKTSGRDLKKLISITCGLEGNPGIKAMVEEKSLTAACALFSEIYGQNLINGAIDAALKKPVPKFVASPAKMVTAEDVNKYYKKVGDTYKLIYENVK